MAIFLEDTNSEKLTLSEEFHLIEVNNYQMCEAAAAADAAWGNITIQAMREEYQALNEGNDENKKGIKNFFSRIIEWVKDFFKTLKDRIKNIFNYLTDATYRMEVFYKKYQKEILKGYEMSKNSDIKVTLPTGFKKLLVVNTFGPAFYNKTKNFSNSEEVENYVKDEIGYDANLTDQKLDLFNAAPVAMENVRIAKSAMKWVKSIASDIQMKLNELDAIAKKGSKAVDQDKQDEAKEATEKSKEKQKKVNISNKVLKEYLRIANTMLATSFKVVKKLYSIGKNNIVKK